MEISKQIEMSSKSAAGHATQAIDQAIRSLESDLQELKRQRERFQATVDQGAFRAAADSLHHLLAYLPADRSITAALLRSATVLSAADALKTGEL